MLFQFLNVYVYDFIYNKKMHNCYDFGNKQKQLTIQINIFNFITFYNEYNEQYNYSPF